MYRREIEIQLIDLIEKFPVLTIIGPRQSGKTTLVRSVFASKPYINLEEPDTRDYITSDPRGFFEQYPNGAILDEIQRAPILLSYIQSIVDDSNRAGLFILTGSHQLQLHEAITQSLAGRTAILELLPLSLTELKQAKINLSVNEYILNGFFPAIYKKQLAANVLYRNYIKTYIEHDVRLLLNIKDLDRFKRFMQLTAGRIGSIVNTENLGNEVGAAHNTIKSWFSILQASYILYRLQPYFENFGKRIIKSPKIYFTDVGLATYLLGIESKTQIDRDRIRGFLFENLVITEILKARMNKGKEPNIYFYRDNHGNEVDIIYKHRNYLIPIEIKSSATFDSSLIKGLKLFKKIAGERIPTSFLVYSGKKEFKIDDIHVINYKNVKSIFENYNLT